MSGIMRVEEDFRIHQAVNDIYRLYGDEVSVSQKKKSLIKFGETLNADNGVKTTIARFQGDLVEETFVVENTIDSISSGSANDVGPVIVEGHYFDSDNNFIFHEQTPILTGQTRVVLDQPLCRANTGIRGLGSFSFPVADLVGPVHIFDNSAAGGITDGAPDTPAATKLYMPAGSQRTEKCQTTISWRDYWIILRVFFALNRASAADVTALCDLEYRQQGGVWIPYGLKTQLTRDRHPSENVPLEVGLIVPKNSDIRAVITSNTANTIGYARMAGVLASIRGT